MLERVEPGPALASLAVLRLYDTAERKPVDLDPVVSGRVSIYSCGPTVYGAPHIGHGRFALVWDIFRRYLEWRGYEVRFASNITDVDDKIIARANREGRSWREVAVQFEEEWYAAMDAVGVKRPDHAPRASEYIGPMIELIRELQERGDAYVTSDGVYLSVDRVPGYGVLAPGPVDALLAGARVEVVEEKRSPRDFALWKKAKPGEPTWDSPWGPGRPGWHTECVVMSLDLLGDGFDIHGGGQDLAFPHHENERAQAVADGRRFARYWLHNGFVEVEGTKMSKSLGNVSNLLDLVEQYDPRAYRLLVLRSHYRSPIDVTDDNLRDAERSLDRLDTFARRAAELGVVAEPDAAAIDRFRAAMDDDLDTPRATALVFDLVRRANALLGSGDAEAAAPLAAAAMEITGALGLELHRQGAKVPEAILELARQRDEARAAKDWARADALRARITDAGYVVEDTPVGTEVRTA
jgi:cysteinyl-tRNA synthetase